MKKLLLNVSMGLLVAGTVIALDKLPSQFRSPEARVTPKQTIRIQKAATTSEEFVVPKYTTHIFDSEYTPQGSCLKIKDSDGTGFTYLTVNDGVGTFSTNSCE